MSILQGGLFSRPAGKTSGLVFSSARTATGKKATVRELVVPSNPRSPGQTKQRNLIRATNFILNEWVRNMDPEFFNSGYDNPLAPFGKGVKKLKPRVAAASLVSRAIGVHADDEGYKWAAGGEEEFISNTTYQVMNPLTNPAMHTQSFVKPGIDQNNQFRVGLYVAYTKSGDWEDLDQIVANSRTNRWFSSNFIPVIEPLPDWSTEAKSLVFVVGITPPGSLPRRSTMSYSNHLLGEIQDMKNPG